MKPVLLAVSLLVATFQLTPLHAKERPRQVAYEPAVVTLGGTIVKEKFGDDASPLDLGKSAWILRLDQRISVPAKPGNQINTAEKNVAEVHLNYDPAKQSIPERDFGKTHFVVTGTLYHAHTTHHLRPIMMIVSTLKPAANGNRPD